LLRSAAGEPRSFITVMEDITPLKEAQIRQRFLTAASEALLSSLEFQATLAEVARLAAGEYADWCLVDALDEQSASLGEVGLAHADAEKVSPLRELRQAMADDRDSAVRLAMAGGNGERLDGLTGEK